MKKELLKFISSISKKIRLSGRYSFDSLIEGREDPSGSIFVTPRGNTINLDEVDIVGACVDTVRQLYSGVLDEGFLSELDLLCQTDDVKAINVQYPMAKLPLGEFSVRKMGKSCGYRYKLQNNEIGLVILVGSYYRKPDVSGAHLKIECSPHFIAGHTPLIFQARLDSIARAILHDWDYQGVAVHLAADIQGWRPGSDFLDNFSTYARMKRDFLGLQTADIGQGFTDVIARYGTDQAQTITIGKPTGLQTSVYNKTAQALHIDKVDAYKQYWANNSGGRYDAEGRDVYRVEVRFHHSVIKDLDFDGIGGIVTFKDISKHLDQLWRYALLRNRLDVETDVIHPVWQCLLEDVSFAQGGKMSGVRRVKKNDNGSIEKNCQLFVGNALSMFARHTDDVIVFIKALRAMGVYDTIVDVYRSHKVGETELRERWAKGLRDRRLLRNAA